MRVLIETWKRMARHAAMLKSVEVYHATPGAPPVAA
jgi:hypothetical protein